MLEKTKQVLPFCAHLSLYLHYRANIGGGSAEPKVENFVFLLSLRSPFTIFSEYRIRFGIAKSRKLRFPFVSALTFHYICRPKYSTQIMVATAEILQTKQRFGIIGNCTGLLRAVSRALQIAPTDLSVLITGESGTGKETFPQIIHANSARKHGRYIAVNCGAIPEGTVDSELFGHEKGSFTGALADRKGYFEEADGGTIFLDEVGELPMTTQARLLRVLENGEFIKVGSSKVQKTNVRIIAATNVNMREAIAEGRFREDLFYRLSTVPIELPPLRDRGDDILLLFRKFAADFAEKYHMPPIQLTEEAQRSLLSYRWPGNIRQLKNVTEQISIFETSREINADTLHTYLPAYDMEKLYRNNRNNLIGKYIESFAGAEADSVEYGALCEGIAALMETRRGEA